MIRPGISVLLDERQALISGARIGVFTNQTGVLPDLTPTGAALERIAHVAAFFAPEHGLLGAAAHGEHITDAADRSGVPIYSLYGPDMASLPARLAGLDALVCDIQDVGCRFYTYVWTLTQLMEAASGAHVPVIVTDRPNPIGALVEGPGVEPAYRSLVGLHNVPIRHGLTIGELALLVNREALMGCDLTVVPCDGWQHAMAWPETGLPWVAPSPNMPAPETAALYPGTCLLEGTNVSVGRGTARPYEWIGAPWIDAVALASALNAQGLPGLRWRPLQYLPCAAPYAGEVCQGVQPYLVDTSVARPVAAGVALTATIRHMYPNRFAWNVAHFDRLAGSERLREQIDAGATLAEITASWPANEQRFRALVREVLLYG